MKHLHAREAAVVAQLLDLVGDDAEVFRHDGQVADRRAHGIKELLARPFHPTAVDSGLRLAVDLPECFEAAEMIDAHDVDKREELAEPRDPPGVALVLHRLPVVLRVAPELTRRAEVVGRYASDRLGRAVDVEVEERLMRPDIGAVL